MAKILGAYQKPGAVFPPEGLGPGTSEGDKAARAIKAMAKHHIEQAVMDEAAAVDGSRPLEQIADSSGFAWGGSCVQTTADLSGSRFSSPQGNLFSRLNMLGLR